MPVEIVKTIVEVVERSTYPGEHLEVVLAVAVGEHAGGELHQRDAERPDVGADVVVRPGRVRRVYPLGLGGNLLKTFIISIILQIWAERWWKKKFFS